MVSLAQMTVAGFAGYGVAIFGTQQRRGDQPRLAVVARGRRRPGRARPCSRPSIGWLSVRTEGIYTIMITLAIGVAFFYLAQQNYTVFNGFGGFSKIAAPELFGIDFKEPVPFYFVALACALAGYFLVQATSCARRSASPCKASATTRAGWHRSAFTSPRTGSRPTPSPACSRRSAAC